MMSKLDTDSPAQSNADSDIQLANCDANESDLARQKKVAKQSGSIFAAQVAGLACGLISNFVVAWILGPVGRGSFYLVQLITTIGQIFLNFGLGPAAVYYLQRDKRFSDSQIRSTLLWSSIIFGSLPLILCGLASPWLASVIGSKLVPVLFWLALASIPGTVLSWNLSFLSLARGATGSFNVLRSAASIFFMASLGMLLLEHDRSAVGVAICWFITQSLTAALAPIVVARRADSQTAQPGFLRAAASFGLRSHAGAVTQYLQHRIDAVLVSFLCSLKDVGLFSLAVSIAELLWYLPNTIANVLISHVAESSEDQGARLTAFLCRVILALTAVLAVFLGIVSSWVIPILLPAFRYSLHILWALLPGTVSVVVFKILSSDLNGRGKPLETFRPAVISLIVCFAAGIVVIPRFGIIGAAVVTSFGYVLNAVLCVYTFSRITTVPVDAVLRLRYADVIALRSLLRRKPVNPRMAQSENLFAD